MSEERVLTCVYCGMEYPQDTPAWGSKILTDHIKICPKHPMREAEKKIDMLKNALWKLVEAETEEELIEMRRVIDIIPGSEKDKSAAILAIDTLLYVLQESPHGA